MGWPDDGVAAMFLVCFFVGLLFTVASFFIGLGHDPAGAGHHAADAGHITDAGHAGPGDQPVGHAAGERAAPRPHPPHGPSLFNLSTAMAFFTWFGGAGYILRVYSTLAAAAALVIAILAGVAGAAIVFFFLSKVLYGNQRVLDPADYYLPGTLARITGPIRVGGTGEIVYTKGDSRQVAGARSADGTAIERGEEVVIMRYERGIAYVQTWAALMQASDDADERDGNPSGTTPAG